MLENDKLSSNDKLRTIDCETMPNQIPPWTDFLSCSVCFIEFLDGQRSPILLGCGHTVCRGCLSKLNNKQCPYDQTSIAKDIENLPINYALLHIGSNNGHGKNVSHDAVKLLAVSKAGIESSPKLKTLSPGDLDCYKFAKSSIENLALYLRSFVNGNFGSLLSRPIQRKLVILVNCQLMEDEGRLRALRVSRSLGERIVTEILILHQNPQQLSSNLWTAVRSRGCQFLGPAMQEEVLKLILLALEDGSALSRKVLVMFVVQRLELHFPQASKTSIGHVVQLLYRGSCFKVSKRKANSSLMQLKEEFRTYEALRREHDVQIVEIATETGLRIAPDQWSSILYGDNLHKSYMQSIIDKLQTSQSFAQALQELFIVLQRTGDPNNLSDLRVFLKHLSNIDLATESSYKNWKIIANSLDSVRKIVIRFIAFLQQHSNRKLQGSTIINPDVKYKMNLCKNVRVERICPCEISCTFAKSEDELENFRSQNRKKDLKFPEMVVSESLDVKLNSSGLHIPFSTTPLFSRISKSSVGYHCSKPLTPRAVLICGKQEAYFEKIGYRNQILRASKSVEDMVNKKSYGDHYASFKMSSPSSVTQSLVMKRLSSKPVELFSNIVEQMEPQVSTGKEQHQHHQSSFDYRFP